MNDSTIPCWCSASIYTESGFNLQFIYSTCFGIMLQDALHLINYKPEVKTR